MGKRELGALRRLIEYAAAEAETSELGLTGYLLQLAAQSVDLQQAGAGADRIHSALSDLALGRMPPDGEIFPKGKLQ